MQFWQNVFLFFLYTVLASLILAGALVAAIVIIDLTHRVSSWFGRIAESLRKKRQGERVK